MWLMRESTEAPLMAKRRNIGHSVVAVNPSSPCMNLLSVTPFISLLFSCRRTPTTKNISKQAAVAVNLIFLVFASVFGFLGISSLAFMHKSKNSLPDSLGPPSSAFLSHSLLLASAYAKGNDDSLTLSRSAMVPLPSHGIPGDDVSKEEAEFWRQPNGEGYRPCLEFSLGYRKASAKISKERRKFLVVVVSGGLNQQRNQIVDAVVIARILGAALVVPILRLNLIWQDESQFSEVFDVEHFKKMLQTDINVVSLLPSTCMMPRHPVEMPHNVSPFWIRARFLKKINKDGVLLLKGLDSKLSKNLPLDLQRLRCKVAFHAIRFTEPIMNLGNRLARRMWIEGPYIALHLRLEDDVWARTKCPTGLGPEFDQKISETWASQPRHLTRHLNMSYVHRRLAGLCPLNALEMARLLEALGIRSTTRMYVAGGKPFGGAEALKQLEIRFPNLVSKETLAHKQELLPYVNKSSALAAIDYIVSLSSDVFIPSHGGNMGKIMQGHRTYMGHRKYITPNKRAMAPLFDDGSLSDLEYGRIVRELHKKSQGQPEPRTSKRDQDVLAYPIPECMCNKGLHGQLF